ncbi:MAG: hypothetical protein CL763_02485 [Chloroflexi bacterium]|nr:hypothetical protein [Chloroflexota bacterium]MQF86539.1 SDR family oxidoreductase [SAR202 cluster bacterium]|tara:strand:- start:12394 stop:13074 length:681 start_codon:yes stop_codon:yes gene_type:complete
MKVLIVGGSSGIGIATVKTFLNAKHDVIATYRTGIPNNELGAYWINADMLRIADIDSIEANISAVDLLILLPGVSFGKSISEYSDDEMDEVLTVNFISQFRIIQRIKHCFSDDSQIIFLGSIAGQRGSADPIYGASKGAVHALAKSLAKSMAPRTRVNVIAPGMVTNTGMYDATNSNVINGHLETTPTRHFISADEIANIILDITQPHWGQLNGACIDLNGGQYLR